MAEDKIRRELTLKQETIFKVFSSVIGKQEIGKLGAAQIEQIFVISEQVAERILTVKG